jgi:hypothetical protein
MRFRVESATYKLNQRLIKSFHGGPVLIGCDRRQLRPPDTCLPRGGSPDSSGNKQQRWGSTKIVVIVANYRKVGALLLKTTPGMAGSRSAIFGEEWPRVRDS